MKVTVFQPPCGHRTLEADHLGVARSTQWAIERILDRQGKVMSGDHFDRVSHLYLFNECPELIWVRSGGCTLNLLTLSAGEYKKTSTERRILIGATRPWTSAVECAAHHNSVAPKNLHLRLMVHV